MALKYFAGMKRKKEVRDVVCLSYTHMIMLNFSC